MFSSHYFCGHLLLATKQNYLLMSTQICVEISACTEANLAWILEQEQLEAKEEMLAYWPSHSIETKDTSVKLWPTKLNSNSTFPCDSFILLVFI